MFLTCQTFHQDTAGTALEFGPFIASWYSYMAVLFWVAKTVLHLKVSTSRNTSKALSHQTEVWFMFSPEFFQISTWLVS